MNKITTSAPGKLLLLGDHAVVYGYPCLVTAVNYRVFAEISIAEKDTFDFPLGTDDKFVRAALSVFRKHYGCSDSFHIRTRCSYDESYGLGSSSAITVAVITALSEHCMHSLSHKELFDLCYEAILEVQGVGSGFDIAAAIWGGTLYFVTGGKKIKPYTGFIEGLPLVVAYSGSKGNTPELIKKVAKLREEKKEMVDKLFERSEWLVDTGKDLLISNNKSQGFGKCMDDNHALLQQLGISTPKLDELVVAARKAGAYGAKLSGAGGGDCMIAIASPDKKQGVEKALEQAGGKIVSIKTNEEGVRIE